MHAEFETETFLPPLLRRFPSSDDFVVWCRTTNYRVPPTLSICGWHVYLSVPFPHGTNISRIDAIGARIAPCWFVDASFHRADAFAVIFYNDVPA